MRGAVSPGSSLKWVLIIVTVSLSPGCHLQVDDLPVAQNQR
jgi:hypothetical protein